MALKATLKTRLARLGHFDPDALDVNDALDFRRIVLWLEEQKIRHFDVSRRSGLRDVESSSWESAFDVYLKSMTCDVSK